MYLVFFEKKLIADFLNSQLGLRLNEGSTHENIYKMIKSYSEYYKKYDEQFFNNLKKFLREYRYFIIDDLAKIEDLKYTLTMELPKDFPCETIMDKRYFEMEKQKIDHHQNKVWDIIDQLKIKFDQQAQLSDTESSEGDEIEIINNHIEQSNENDSFSSCIPFRNWFGQCWARLFSSHHDYAPLPTMSINADENPNQMRKNS